MLPSTYPLILLAPQVSPFAFRLYIILGTPSNAPPPISVTESGIFIDVSPLQPLNVPKPMLVTELGIVNSVSTLQPSNA